MIACKYCKYLDYKQCKHNPKIVTIPDAINGVITHEYYDYCSDKNKNNDCKYFVHCGILKMLFRKFDAFMSSNVCRD